MSVQLKESDSVVTNGWVPRYDGVERFLHWLLTIAFFPLVFTGMVLLFPVFAPLARGEAGLFIRVVHRIFAVLFMALPIIYLILCPRRLFRNLRDVLSIGRSDTGWLKAAIPYYLNGRHGAMPPQGRFNAGEKLNAIVLILGTILFTFTGLLMWFGKGYVSTGVFRTAVIVHDLTMAVVVTMFLVHLYLAVAHPLMWQAMVGMRFGRVSESFAREHHAAWYFGEERAWQMYERQKAVAMSGTVQQTE